MNKATIAILRLAALAVIVVVFFGALAGVVLMSLQGSEITVPEVKGKSFADTEHELALLGLKVKKRAERVSAEPPNSVIEQLPRAGETVKTGQMIYVVTSKGGGTPDETLPEPKTDTDDSDKIEEMISDKPKKPRSNTNSNTAKKKADTTRDITDGNSNSDSNSSGGDSNSIKKDPGVNAVSSPAANKQVTNGKPNTTDPKKPGADTRPRVTRPQ